LGEEPNPPLSSSHMHASLSLASLQQLLYHIMYLIALQEKLRPMINMKPLAHCCFITTLLNFCLFGFPICCSPVLCKIATSWNLGPLRSSQKRENSGLNSLPSSWLWILPGGLSTGSGQR
jgi:hypothetical protein